MKLKKDCVRDVLLYLENNLELYSTILSSDIALKKYSQKDVTYTILKLSEAGYLNTSTKYIDGTIPINSITYNGHQFLDNIRDSKVWTKTKSVLSKVESASLEIISSTAAKVLLQLLEPIDVS